MVRSGTINLIIGILGVVVSFFAGLGIISPELLHDRFPVLNWLTLCLGIAVVVLAYRNKSDVSLRFVQHDLLPKKISDTFKDSEEILVYNPHKCPDFVLSLLDSVISNSTRVSVVGDPTGVLKCITQVRGEDLKKVITEASKVAGFLQGVPMLLTIRNGRKFADVFIIRPSKCLHIRLCLEKNIGSAEDLTAKYFVSEDITHLADAARPEVFLGVLTEERAKYLKHFSTLKAGYISFYGTEVLNAQSGWLEDGKFSKIRTLDLTVNPEILLTRHRYNTSNKSFIANGGEISRVYLVERKASSQTRFVKSLIELIELQKEMGVQIGLQFVEDLSADQRQDFILYDNSLVFVQETQANYDYSFGKSTAYLDRDTIRRFEKLFTKVWSSAATGTSAMQQLDVYLKTLNSSQ